MLFFVLFILSSTIVSSEKIKLKFSCNDLHVLYDESKNFVNLRRIYDNLLRKNDVTLSQNELGYEFFKSKPLDFNVSEEYLKAEIFSQTASLFYDQIKYNDYDNDIPSLFQNYSHCFLNLDSKKVSKSLNLTKANDYRSIDGSNNNHRQTSIGASYTSYGRLLKSHYDDRIHSVRKSVRGYKLPSPRNIVRKLFLYDEFNLNKFKGRKLIPNVAAVMFGQYIAHDIGSRQSAQYVDGGDAGIRCCSNFNKIQLPSSLLHSACMPITISRSDPFYSPQNIKCMSFVRSSMISNNPRIVEVGEKVNTVTSFLDHSNIYGSSHKTMKMLRSYNGGRLRMNIKNVLPTTVDGTYFSGDDRVNQSPFLAFWHSIFTRNHNHLADKLAIINRHWDEEKLFNEAKKINVAIYQNIIYDEWLKIFLGRKCCEKFDVDYNETVDASTTNEFSAAAFRYLHSFIPSKFSLYNSEMQPHSLNFSDIIPRVKLLENSFDDFLRGLLKDKMRLVGYSSEILNKLFKNKEGLGLDLLSMDIFRGRDHGIPAYYKYRKMCNMKSNIKVFNDLAPQIPNSAIVQMRQTYKTVFDIDLLVGGALESISQENGLEENLGFFGPTFKCLVTEQFYRLRAGDFFFFTHQNQFSKEQLDVIKSSTIQHLLCENSDVESVQRSAFLTDSKLNPLEKCGSIPLIDLKAWRENID